MGHPLVLVWSLVHITVYLFFFIDLISKWNNVLANEVANLAGVDVKSEVFDALENNAYCVTAAVDYLINVRNGSKQIGNHLSMSKALNMN